jgi:hypothetical protein
VGFHDDYLATFRSAINAQQKGKSAEGSTTGARRRAAQLCG